jgi:hypothetical protein
MRIDKNVIRFMTHDEDIKMGLFYDCLMTTWESFRDLKKFLIG